MSKRAVASYVSFAADGAPGLREEGPENTHNQREASEITYCSFVGFCSTGVAVTTFRDQCDLLFSWVLKHFARIRKKVQKACDHICDQPGRSNAGPQSIRR